MSLPYLGFYWNREDGEVRKDVKSYHFNPGQDEPPYSIPALQQLIEDFIAEYKPTEEMSAHFAPPPIDQTLNAQLGTVQCKHYDYDFQNDVTCQLLSADLTAYNGNYLSTTYYTEQIQHLSGLSSDGNYTAAEIRKMAADITARAYLGEYDGDGILYPCDLKKELSCKQGSFALSAIAADGKLTVYDKICKGTALPVKDGVYQFYIYDGSTAYQYDTDSVIFKVVDGVVQYVYSGQLRVDAGTQKAVSFQPGQWYTYTAEDSAADAQQFIDECNANGSVYDGVIVQCYGSDGL